MPLDFPDSPLIGDVHTEAGVEYVFAGGGVWNLAGGGDLTEYVLKTGDTMTGELSMSGVPVRYMDRSYPTPNASELVLTCDNKGYPNWNKASIRYSGDGYTKGWLEIWDTDVKNVAFKHSGIEVARPIKIGDGAGIHWGSTGAQTDKYNFSEGICLYGYGGTSQFGFTITNGTLNYCVQNEGNKHDFWVGSKNALTIEDMEVRPINKVIGRTITDGLNGYFIGDNWHGMCFNGANALQFIEYHAKWQFVERKTGTTGGTIIYLIDNVGSSGNSVSVTAPEALATARSLAVEPDEERGVDVMKVMAALLAKVNRLEAELATLKGGPTVEVKTVNVAQPKPTRAPPPSPRRR